MQDDFDLDELEGDNPENKVTPKDKFNNVLAYVPFLNLWLLFSGNIGEKKINRRYIKQGITLFLLYVFVFLVFGVFSFKLSFLVTLLYLASVVFFAAKAYNGMYVEIGFIENIMKQFEKKDLAKYSQARDDSKKDLLGNEFREK